MRNLWADSHFLITHCELEMLAVAVAYAGGEDGKEDVGDDHSGKDEGGNKHTVCKERIIVYAHEIDLTLEYTMRIL